MSFYQEISRYYDSIFPMQEPTLQLLEQLASNNHDPSRILDIACGTGAYAEALARSGHDTFACDLDESMVDAASARRGVRAFSADMSDLARAPQLSGLEGSFDLIYSIGNSLVHLPDEAAITSAIRGMTRYLAPSGRLLIQIINYDRILDGRIDRLPDITDSTIPLRFERYYDRPSSGHFLLFRTVLTIGNDSAAENTYENVVPLYPLRSGSLRAIYTSAGLTDTQAYGSFAGSAFDPHASQPFILIGRKRSARQN